jgi:DNA-binding transcriptional LysR family regulator
MIEIKHINVFLRVAETLNFTEAARQLHVSQPTVSKYIKGLERELGVQLFDRSGMTLNLTDAGISLLPGARKLVHQSIEMQEMMASMQTGIGGHLRIACSTTAGKYILPKMAARFRMRYPGIKISILTCTPDDVTIRLLKSEAQLGVVSREVCENGLICQYFFEDVINMVVPAGHRWTSQALIELEELLKEPMILREPTSGTRRVMLEALARHDIALDDLNVFLELGNAEAIVETLAAGYGVSFVSRISAIRPLKEGVIKEVHFRGIELSRRLMMVRRELDAHNRARDVFWQFIHDPANKDLYSIPGVE